MAGLGPHFLLASSLNGGTWYCSDPRCPQSVFFLIELGVESDS